MEKKCTFAFMDSGVGGLPYLQELVKVTGFNNCVYYADTRNFPYGEKTDSEIIENACKGVALLIEKFSPEVIVVACNTMSVAALESLRAGFPSVEFVGTVPAVKTARRLTKNRIIGLLATERTVNHKYTGDLIKKFAGDCTVVKRGDSSLIRFIETRLDSSSPEEKYKALEPCFTEFKNKNVDTVILACTHFLRMTGEFKNMFEPEIKVIDSLEGVVNQAVKLSEKYPEAEKKSGTPVVYISGQENEDKNNTDSHYKDLCGKLNFLWGGILK